MLRDPVFYVMIVMMCCGAFSGLMIISQASPVAQRMVGLSVTEAAAAVSVLALFNTAGRILTGFSSDKLGTIRTILLVFAVSAAGLSALSFCGPGGKTLFYTGLCAVGLAFGSIMGIYPGFTASQFGAKNNSVNYGIMFIGFRSWILRSHHHVRALYRHRWRQCRLSYRFHTSSHWICTYISLCKTDKNPEIKTGGLLCQRKHF